MTNGDAQAAAIAGYGLDAFRRVWEILVRDAGMPSPTYNLKRDGTASTRRSWDLLALERWAEQRRDPRYRAAVNADSLAGERARLDRRLSRIEGVH